LDVSEIFKALADDTRMRILNLISNRELCVCQINGVLRMTQSNASRHLNRLKFAGLICCRKISQWCFYSINKQFLNEHPLLFDYLMYQWTNNRKFIEDKNKLDHILKTNDCCKDLIENQ